MTEQEKLNELTNEIRKSIPRLIELSEGCIIKPHKQNEFMLDATYKIKKTNYGTFIYSLLDAIDYYSVLDIEILGHEPKLNDVLEWLKIKGLQITDTTDTLLLCFGGYKYYSFWDLSKNYLKDQSPELIWFLHSLIPNK